MIKFKLICKDCDNSFDSWFSSSKEYDKLKKKKFLNCDNCNSLNIEKTLMSPSVFTSRSNIKIKTEDKNYQEIKKKMFEYQKFIKNNFNHVGENFAYRARSIYYNNKKNSKGIYGTATKKEIKELREEGIETQMIPWIKNSTN